MLLLSNAAGRLRTFAPGTRPYRPAPEGQCPMTACEALCTAASCICATCRCAACTKRRGTAKTPRSVVERGGQFAFFRVGPEGPRFNPITHRFEGTTR